jgi:hypothetical protein
MRSWQAKHVELASEATNKWTPSGLCMLWQPAQSPTPPEWNVCANPFTLVANRNVTTIATVNFSAFIFPSSFSYFYSFTHNPSLKSLLSPLPSSSFDPFTA